MLHTQKQNTLKLCRADAAAAAAWYQQDDTSHEPHNPRKFKGQMVALFTHVNKPMTDTNNHLGTWLPRRLFLSRHA